MANTAAVCTIAKVDALKAIVPNASTIKAALYMTTATVDASSTVYTTSGEVSASGTGYTTAGNTVTHANAALSTGTTAYWTPSANITFTGLTVGSPGFDAAMLYDTSRSSAAVCILTFGAQIITAGDFTITMPTNDATSGLLRLGN